MNKTTEKINKDLILREKLALQRTVLANQTTLLSFVRTALYFLVAGLSLGNLLQLKNSLWLQIIFFLIAFSIFIIGLFNFYKQKKIIKVSEIHIGDYKTEYLN
jgi:putative membrane protein